MFIWLRNIRRKRQMQMLRLAVVIVALLAAFAFTINIRSAQNSSLHSRLSRSSGKQIGQSSFNNLWSINMFSDSDSDSQSDATFTPLLTYHPFNNSCKFPLPNTYAIDIMDYTLSERLRQMKCPIKEKDYASMDSEGFMYVHPHFVDYPRLEHYVSCKVDIIEGGLRQPEKNMTKNMFIVEKTLDAPSDERFFVNADAFIVKCYNRSKTAVHPEVPVWSKPFPGMKDRNLPINEILRAKDLPSYGDYGNKIRTEMKKPVERYSVDILGFDSTARTMFMRHMPRTVETMEKLGFHFLYGYTKVADNSMVNLAPILVGDIPEALAKPKHDDSGDININWILPTQDKTDPTKLEFLWKVMKEKYGCESLFNEDISGKSLGLFNYPGHEFLPGFTENPADHYYRAYYLAVYENWKYEACKNGEQLQNEFVNIWRRFAHRYNNICHFGFTFVTTLTHEAGFVLEVLDEKVSSHLNALHVDGDLENSISVIMGDHGNRIGAIQRRYHGRIEERMPLMAIRLPTDFAQKFPEEYRNFLDNKYKLTSNFDIHKTLHDIVHMRLGKDKTDSLNNDNGRGISLFDAISSTRTCYEANIPENFCMCMTDVSNVTSPLPNVTKKNASEQKKDQFDTLKGWLKKEKLEECVDISSLETQDDFKEMAINPYARYGLRTKSNVTQNEIALKHQEKNPNLQYNSFEFTVVGSYLTSEEPLSMLVRTEIYFERNISSVVFEPMIRESPAKCQFVSIFDVCKCLLNNNL